MALLSKYQDQLLLGRPPRNLMESQSHFDVRLCRFAADMRLSISIIIFGASLLCHFGAYGQSVKHANGNVWDKAGDSNPCTTVFLDMTACL